MQIRELKIPDAYEITPMQFGDDRGVFLEWYRFDRLEEAVGHPPRPRAGEHARSRARGVVRGIHFADIPPSQAKYVTVTHGAVLDFVIDIRVGSPTFGQWDSVLLDDVDRRAIYLAEGLGHAFVALTDDATVSYLVTATSTTPSASTASTRSIPSSGSCSRMPPASRCSRRRTRRRPSLAEAAGAPALASRPGRPPAPTTTH